MNILQWRNAILQGDIKDIVGKKSVILRDR